MSQSRKDEWRQTYRRFGERDTDFETISGEPVEPLYTPEDVADIDESFTGQFLRHILPKAAAAAA